MRAVFWGLIHKFSYPILGAAQSSVYNKVKWYKMTLLAVISWTTHGESTCEVVLASGLKVIS